MKRIHITIKGKVTGVFFRKFIKRQADNLKVTGWVKNRLNHVEAVFEGSDANLNKLILLCKKGPTKAKVENITFQEEPIKGETSFEIKS